jgi:hypothetical protein
MYKKAHKPLAEIARELNVESVVEGSVGAFRRPGSDLRPIG